MMISYKYARSKSFFLSFLRGLHSLFFLSSSTFSWPVSSSQKRALPLKVQCLLKECEKCVKACPTQAIFREKNLINVRKEACIDCDYCRDICPSNYFDQK